jgi:hypothetical protein
MSNSVPKWMQSMLDKSGKKHSYIQAVQERQYIPMMSMNCNGWTEYTKVIRASNEEPVSRHLIRNDKGENKHDGFLSPNAAKKVRKIINFMVYLSHIMPRDAETLALPYVFKLNLITLTLPSKQMHSDQYLKRHALQVFLDYMKRNHELTIYFWKAEIQDNGNIHFHITGDKWIHWKIIQTVWNRCLDPLGYIDTFAAQQKELFKNGFRIDLRKVWKNKKTKQMEAVPTDLQMNRYLKGSQSGWRNPNSTDVHAVSKISNLAGYLAGYLSKKDLLKKSAPGGISACLESFANDYEVLQELKEHYPQHFKRPIHGRIWSSSKNLTIASLKCRITDEIRSDLLSMSSTIARKVYSDAFCICYAFVDKISVSFPTQICSLWKGFLWRQIPELAMQDSS